MADKPINASMDYSNLFVMLVLSHALAICMVITLDNWRRGQRRHMA
jgi:hypothetical protein